MRRTISGCPVCDEAVGVTELTCQGCGLRLSGNFSATVLARLASEHQEFLVTFIRCRGIIRDVERALGISYPTVRAKLDSAVSALEDAQAAEAADTARARPVLNTSAHDTSAPAGLDESSVHSRALAARVAATRELRRESEREHARRAILRRVEDGTLDAADAADALRLVP